MSHGYRYVADGQGGLIPAILQYFPGVPIFFFASGFMIAASYDRSVNLNSFLLKRALRIFPALWVCVLGTIALVFAVGYLQTTDVTVPRLLTWIAAQSSILQFYNPEFARHFGAGIINPALWTISVELQFYIVMPIIAWLYIHQRRLFYTALGALIVISMVYNQYLDQFFGQNVLVKLLGVSFLPWVSMFAIGNIAYYLWDEIRPLIEGKSAFWFAAYLVAALVVGWVEQSTTLSLSGNHLFFPLYLVLSGLVLSLAYTKVKLPNVTRGVDISYGVYIWHMPVIGTWLYLGLPSKAWSVFVCVLIAVVLAVISWHSIEKHALRLKPKSKSKPAHAIA